MEVKKGLKKAKQIQSLQVINNHDECAVTLIQEKNELINHYKMQRCSLLQVV